jgi:hypothetical protein
MLPLARRLIRLAVTLSPILAISTSLTQISVAKAQEVVATQRAPSGFEETHGQATSGEATAPKPPIHTVQLQTANGFGVFATVRDRSVDLTAPDHLTNGPNGVLFDEAAGIGWRHSNVSAMVGYMRPVNDRPVYVDEGLQIRGEHGRVGVGLSLHY